MCLMAMAWRVYPQWPLVLAANRDEFHDRESAPMSWWKHPDILAGRDLRAGGTWLGLNRTGRIGLLTNVREPGHQQTDLPSRGELVPLWLQETQSAAHLSDRLQATPANGYNLLGIDLGQAQAHCWSNRHGHQHELPAGLYGLSNAALDTPWPKLKRLKNLLAKACQQPQHQTRALSEQLLIALADRDQPADEHLPRTGVSMDWERWLSPIFIQTPDRRYGTRCSTVIVVELLRANSWRLHVAEQSWNAQGQSTGRVEESWDISR